MRYTSKLIILTMFGLALLPDITQAASRSWTGLGTNSLWSTTANWSGNTAPQAGDDLVFPAGASRQVNTNDLAVNVVFSSLVFSNQNYVLRGNALGLLNGIHGRFSSGTNTVGLPVTLLQPQTFTNSGNGTLLFTNGINTSSHNLTLRPTAGEFTFQSGGLITNGGQCILQGPGRVLFNNVQPVLSVILDGGTLGGHGAIGALTTLTGGTVNPGLATGVMTCSNLLWNAATTFTVDLNGLSQGSTYDYLLVKGTVNLNGAALAAAASFQPPIGTSSFLVLANDGIDPIVGTFAGLPEGASTLFGGLEVAITYAGGDGNDIELIPLNNFAIWDGGGALGNTNWSNPLNWHDDVVPVYGSSVLFPPGAPGLTNYNDLTNGIFLRNVRITGPDYQLRGTNRIDSWRVEASNPTGTVSFSPTLRALLNPFVITNSPGGTFQLNGTIESPGAQVALSPAGLMILNGQADGFEKRGPGILRLPVAQSPTNFASTAYVHDGIVQMLHDFSLGGAYIIISSTNARVELLGSRILTNQIFVAGTLATVDSGSSNRCTGLFIFDGPSSTIETAAGSSLLVNFPASTTNPFFKSGGGSLYLGTQPCCRVFGQATLMGGTVFWEGASLPTAPVLVNNGSTLSGRGQAGIITNSPGGVVSPGAGSGTPGTLTVSDGAFFQTNSILRIQMKASTLSSGYSQLRVTNGPVVINGALLQLDRTFTPLPGDTFVIVSNRLAGPVVGSFAGLPEGGSLTNGGVAFQITYAGGDGNDVVLTTLTAPVSSEAIPLSAGAYSQNFNTLAGGGTANTWNNGVTLNGWYAAQSSSGGVVSAYRASNGGDSTGALYSYGSSGDPERALGSQASGTPGTFAYGVCLINDTTNTVSGFRISYTGEQWRCGGSGSVTNTLSFWYRVTPVILTTPQPANTVDWTSVPALHFASPTVLGATTSLNGNLATNRQSFTSISISGLAVAPGESVFFRWRDVDDSGADQGISVDDLTISFGAAPVAPAQFASATLSNGLPQLNGMGSPNSTYRMEAATNLAPPVTWQPLGNILTDGSGAFTFTDTNTPVAPMRFYRAVNP